MESNVRDACATGWCSRKPPERRLCGQRKVKTLPRQTTTGTAKRLAGAGRPDLSGPPGLHSDAALAQVSFADSEAAGDGAAGIAASLSGQSLLDIVRLALDDAKAENIVEIALAGKTVIADHMVVASGRSNRHVGAIAEQLAKKLKSLGMRPKVEGMPSCDWVLVDAGDVIVHVFRPEVREFYNLEKMWSAESPAADAVSRPVLV